MYDRNQVTVSGTEIETKIKYLCQCKVHLLHKFAKDIARIFPLKIFLVLKRIVWFCIGLVEII
jgi:hypothetical protein